MHNNKLAHTTWECKYHLVWIPKKRRKVIYGKLKQEIGFIIRKLCEFQRKRLQGSFKIYS
jgi:putative transposase